MISLGARTTLALGIHTAHAAGARLHLACEIAGIDLQRHLKKYSGILQADAYGCWIKLYDSGNVTEAACWAHARRPWWDLYLSTWSGASR